MKKRKNTTGILKVPHISVCSGVFTGGGVLFSIKRSFFAFYYFLVKYGKCILTF